jgi:phosphodiesterase/alkaline phosphatase D-like protein
VTLHRRQFLQLAASAAALPTMPGITSAQSYPGRPITLVVGAAAGGPTDTIGRIITESMRALLGQTIVIETMVPLREASRTAGSHALHPTATRSASGIGGRTLSTELSITFSTMC